MINAQYPPMLVIAAMTFLVTAAPVMASEMDGKIESSARNSYVFKTYLSEDDVKVTSKDGVVTLTGTVKQESNKDLAHETVASLPGVESVDNRLELETEIPADSNEWLRLKIQAALLFHRNVSVTNTQVHVEEGIVTLRGEAESEAQKELTAEYADVDGVREVKNEMTIAKTPAKVKEPKKEEVDDASITAQAKIALLTHRATSVLKTSVATRNGIVTLGGKAKNAAEKDLVTKLVNDIHGVKNVVNNMTLNV